MLTILSKLFGPHRAVTIYAFLQTRGIAILGVLVLIAIVSGIYLSASVEDHEHEAFLTLPVLSATPINGDIKTGIIISVRLPEGGATSITSTEGHIARTVTTQACVEKRVYVASGEARYRLKLPNKCTAGE